MSLQSNERLAGRWAERARFGKPACMQCNVMRSGAG